MYILKDNYCLQPCVEFVIINTGQMLVDSIHTALMRINIDKTIELPQLRSQCHYLLHLSLGEHRL